MLGAVIMKRFLKFLAYFSGTILLIFLFNKDLFFDKNREFIRVAHLASPESYSVWRVDFIIDSVNPLVKNERYNKTPLKAAFDSGNIDLFRRVSHLLTEKEKEMFYMEIKDFSHPQEYMDKVRCDLVAECE